MIDSIGASGFIHLSQLYGCKQGLSLKARVPSMKYSVARTANLQGLILGEQGLQGRLYGLCLFRIDLGTLDWHIGFFQLV